jgi:type VI protein secretion system component Hcp
VKKVMLAIVLLVCLGVPPTAAQTPQTFLLIPGIQGSSLDAGHRNWIDVVSLAQTLNESHQCSLEVMKALDVAGPLLWGAAVAGQTFAEVRIDVTTVQEQPITFYQILLQNAHITSISTIGNGGYVERVTLDASVVTLRFRRQNPNGSFGAFITSTFSC